MNDHHRIPHKNRILGIEVVHYAHYANFDYCECREVSIAPSNDRYDDQNGTDTNTGEVDWSLFKGSAGLNLPGETICSGNFWYRLALILRATSEGFLLRYTGRLLARMSPNLDLRKR